MRRRHLVLGNANVRQAQDLQDPVIGAAALVLALVPLAILGALSPGYRMAPISAVIVLLGGPGPDAEVLSQGFDRVLGVAIGCGAGVLVSMLVLPARASRAAVTTAGEIAQLMADQLRALTSGGDPAPVSPDT